MAVAAPETPPLKAGLAEPRSAEWPYDLPIWRGSYRAASPNGRFVAEIAEAVEVSMGNPTMGTLTLTPGLSVPRCNPSFIWSDDSRYLAVPQYFYRFGLFRRQRLLVIDTVGQRVFASAETAFYFQPKAFVAGCLVVTQEPTKTAIERAWSLPGCLTQFKLVDYAWPDTPRAAARETR